MTPVRRSTSSFDFSSPYSYIASEWIEALAARHGRTVRWQAILLGVTFQAAELRSPVSHPIKREYTLLDFERSARFAGVPLQLPDHVPDPDAERGARLLVARRRAAGDARAPWARHCLRAYFTPQRRPRRAGGAEGAGRRVRPRRRRGRSGLDARPTGRRACDRRATTRSRTASSARRSSSSTASRSGATTGARRSSAGSQGGPFQVTAHRTR